MADQTEKTPSEQPGQPVETPNDNAPATDAEAKNAADESNPMKKRKVALFLSYVGHGYQGRQRNPGARTIEDDLFKAISEAGGISEANSDEKGFQKVLIFIILHLSHTTSILTLYNQHL